MAKERGSIRQNPTPAALPDLCNLGVMLRVLLAVNAFAALALLARDPSPQGLVARMIALAAWVEPILMASVLTVCAARHWLARLRYRLAYVAALILVMAVAWLLAMLMRQPLDSAALVWPPMFWSAIAAACILSWLTLLQQARSPALAEARLMALTARIRPHFLFNSLNAILGVMRSDPRRAEAALEELSELFRALMHDPRELVLLSDEIALARRYLELERLRLGERLKVNWDVASCPPDALMPPLMLQPLLENAVYHGIEPASNPGSIDIRLQRLDQEVRIELSNPVEARHTLDKGNQMALANIRERLMLFFDLEASLDTQVRDGCYTVRIQIPYRRA
jgi:two-component system sensor histidine kinase AlgZ